VPLSGVYKRGLRPDCLMMTTASMKCFHTGLQPDTYLRQGGDKAQGTAQRGKGSGIGGPRRGILHPDLHAWYS
jgi:hypothetical protein